VELFEAVMELTCIRGEDRPVAVTVVVHALRTIGRKYAPLDGVDWVAADGGMFCGYWIGFRDPVPARAIPRRALGPLDLTQQSPMCGVEAVARPKAPAVLLAKVRGYPSDSVVGDALDVPAAETDESCAVAERGHLDDVVGGLEEHDGRRGPLPRRHIQPTRDVGDGVSERAPGVCPMGERCCERGAEMGHVAVSPGRGGVKRARTVENHDGVMASKGKRRFGTVRALPSGRWQARYRGPDGQMRPAPQPFLSERDAEQWLSVVESELLRGEWIDPWRSAITLSEFGQQWIKDRELKPRTRDDYEGIFRNHIEPHLGAMSVGEIDPATVRRWRTTLLDGGMSGNRAAKVYRLLRAIMNTAKDDELIRRNPCRIKGADKETESSRPVATVPQVYALADEVPRRFRALVLLGAFTSLRWGELVNLRRCDVNATTGVVYVIKTLSERDNGRLDPASTPKSPAGVRSVAVPALVMADLVAHLAEFTDPAPDAFVFLGELGGRLRRSNFRRATHWGETVQRVGLPADFHFHDLRHTGNQLAAEAGATTKELMRRMGHSTVRAAMRYQHSTDRRDRQIAAEMSRRAKRGKGRST
jgi:integrase